MPAIGRSAFLGQAEGYLVPFSGLDSSTHQITQVLVGFAPDGSTTGQTVIEDGPFGPEQHLVVADPRGGALLVDVTTAPGSAPRAVRVQAPAGNPASRLGEMSARVTYTSREHGMPRFRVA